MKFAIQVKKLIVLGAFVVSGFSGGAEAAAFRGSDLVTVDRMNLEDLRAAVLEEVMAALGTDRVNQQKLQILEEQLQPMFQAMPKNAYGNLDHASSRYVLHRLFVQRHAMYIKGLEPGSSTWNSSSSATEVLEDRVPTIVQSIFEDRLKGRGLGVHELAVLTATLEHLIHDESIARLQFTYKARGHSLDDRLDEVAVQQVLETYMMFFIKGRNVHNMTAQEVARDLAGFEHYYLLWGPTRKFLQQVRSNVVASNAANTDFALGKLTFGAVSKVAEEVGEQYGSWQNAECLDLKGALVELEDTKPGRVLLKDFYNQVLTGKYMHFGEKVEYLRELGALDESDPKRPAVIIPNYVYSPTNCLASSSMHSVCCINECENLLGHLERQIASPEASVSRIVDIVSGLPSSTVSAPRTLPPSLISRLEEVANHHGGSVPLHGRLFAQWLHHAYPRECPYPHTSGTTNPMTADQWMQATGGQSRKATKEEMKIIVQKAESEELEQIRSSSKTDEFKTALRNPQLTDAISSNETVSAPLPWVLKEELLTKAPQEKVSKTSSLIRLLVFIAAAASVFKALGNSLSSAQTTMWGSAKKTSPLLPVVKKQHMC